MTTTTPPPPVVDPSTDPTGGPTGGPTGSPERDSGDSLAFFAIGLAALSIVTALFAVGLSVRAVQRVQRIEDPAPSGPQPVTISLSEFKISPAEIRVPAGTIVTVKNTGTTAHDFSVGDLQTPSIAGGGEEFLDLSALAPGTYEVICTVTGHKESGMTATLIVT